ncbi:MAG TPA: ATP-binding protein [Anaerolineae bacterium]
MTRSLIQKLTLAFLLVALTAALLVALIIRLNSPTQLDSLIIDQQRGEYKTLLTDYYQEHGSWDGVRAFLAQSRSISTTQSAPSRSTPSLSPQANPPAFDRDPLPSRRSLFGLVNAQGIVVVPLLPAFPPNSNVSADSLTKGEPIEVDGALVGTILTAPSPPGLTPQENAYLQRTNNALLLASAGAVLVALLVGILLARNLTHPLRALTIAAQQMSRGELKQEVVVKSGDEIGQLATAFNHMSQEIARSSEIRRQMTADVAHELRTPLTVIAGYVESMRDGTLMPTPERLAVVYAEIEHLQHLVGDLRILAQAETGELKLDMHPVSPLDLLQQSCAAFENQALRQGVHLTLHADENLPAIRVDEVRMTQVLDNLISNALRFTPPYGQITLHAASKGDQVMLAVQDTGQGISPADLPSVFNRFYRADKSRTSNNGEFGLGLAIAKALVEAHAGKMDVTSTPGEGTTFTIHLPAHCTTAE